MLYTSGRVTNLLKVYICGERKRREKEREIDRKVCACVLGAGVVWAWGGGARGSEGGE